MYQLFFANLYHLLWKVYKKSENCTSQIQAAMHLYCILLLANFFDEFEVILSKQKFDEVGVLWKRNSCISLLLRTNGQFHAWKTFFVKKEWMVFKLCKFFMGILRYSGILSLVLGQAKSVTTGALVTAQASVKLLKNMAFDGTTRLDFFGISCWLEYEVCHGLI